MESLVGVVNKGIDGELHPRTSPVHRNAHEAEAATTIWAQFIHSKFEDKVLKKNVFVQTSGLVIKLVKPI